MKHQLLRNALKSHNLHEKKMFSKTGQEDEGAQKLFPRWILNDQRDLFGKHKIPFCTRKLSEEFNEYEVISHLLLKLFERISPLCPSLNVTVSYEAHLHFLSSFAVSFAKQILSYLWTLMLPRRRNLFFYLLASCLKQNFIEPWAFFFLSCWQQQQLMLIEIDTHLLLPEINIYKLSVERVNKTHI